MLCGGWLIAKKDVTDTDFNLSLVLASQTFGIYCPNNQFTDGYNVKFGEGKGNAAKVMENKHPAFDKNRF
ncbi:hypothetical protein [Paenibacillus sp. EZ-K15]|uniref:hypothetical protein n=1 Tax=Paenibacillus sp. EZ-K15 TaxID=2044275 RepID=UPI000BFAA9A8|nr:hypothetical protein [Paenibacillus sp. EZ-K15]